ncbi:TRP-domain-containing protein [Imleria badia]|nr:TRP-domain-containing protein [Imleria badia]
MLVARMRRLAPLLFLIPAFQVSARDDSLFTSSVTYCSEPDALLIQQFDVAYFQKNSSIWFNISAASVEPNVSVSANVMLNVYGMHPVNFTLDLCSLFNGALCPLPTYNFTGSDSIPLPSSLGVNDKIPSIAFQIPDLEAYAQLTLTDVATGQQKACVQATLSNGWSAHQVAVEWATGALGLLALLSAIWHSLSPDALAPYRLFDLFYLFQWAASTAFLDLNYSSVYIAFATNFSWALGLFPASATSPIQLSINNMRHLTGGNMADATSSSAVALVNRQLSPYNAVVTSMAGYQTNNLATETLTALGNFTAPGLTLPAFFSTVQELDNAGTVQVVTATSSNVLQAGVPIYVEYVGIATANAFMTIFLVALMILAILTATLALGYGVLVLAGRRTKHNDLCRGRELYPAYAYAWLLRVCFVAITPICIFAMYQWTLKDSWLSILLSVVLFLGMLGLLLFSIFHVVCLAIHATPYALYTRPKTITAYGPLFALYRPERYFASIPFLVSILAKAMFTAFAQTNGEVQVISILVIECAVLAYLLFIRPHKTRGADILATYLALTRVICTGLLIAFIQDLNVAAIPRVAIGIAIAVIISIAVIVMFINTLVNLGFIKVPASFRRHQATSSDASTVEKGEKEDAPGRPRNPTPERNIPVDPTMNQPYPESPSEILTDEHSTYSEESGSTTLGSLLPRRWSLQPSAASHSRTPSQSQYSSTSASSPRHSHPPSPYPQSAPHSKHATIDEHEPTAF